MDESSTLLSAARVRFSTCRFCDDDPEVYSISNWIAEGERQDNRVKTRLLADAVCIGPELMPDIYRTFAETLEQLGLSSCVDGYVYNDVAPQAQCIFVGGETKAAVLVSSGIVSLLDSEELQFVIGHELGHLIFGHHGYPDPRSARDDNERLNWLALQRAAEISADRIGYLASRSMDTAVRAIIKTSTGLESNKLRFDVARYLDQLRTLSSLGGNEDVVFASHPMFPVRMKALLWFEMSEPLAQIKGSARRSAISAEKLDQRIAKDLETAGASVLSRIREETLQSAAVWAFLYIAVADNKLSKDEQAQLRESFGEKVAADALQYVQDNGPDGVREKFELSMQRIRTHPVTVRKQFMESISGQFRHDSGGSDLDLRMLNIIGDRLNL
jgi:hypothetical protein